MMRKEIITMNGKPLTLRGQAIKVGDLAPDFTVIDQALNPVKLSDAKGKKVVISVVPSIDTSVCAAQTRRFNEAADKLDNVVIYTISLDLPFALKRFCSAEGIESIQVLSDHKDLDFGEKYGFVIDELRLLARGIVVVDESGRVVHVEYVSEVSNHPDYDQALEVLN